MPFDRPIWPNGAMCAVALTFDNFGESLDLLKFGHAGGALSDGIYAPRRGVERILDILDRQAVPGTFFVEGWNARKYPDLLRSVAARGHEVGGHGWMHETWDKLAPDQERALIARTTAELAAILGRAPRGWRAPGGVTTPLTLPLVLDAGYRYDSSFGDEDVPYHMAVTAERPSDSIVELPWTWQLDDAVFYGGTNRVSSAQTVLDLWKEEFDAAYAMTGFYMPVCHPRFSGRPARAIALDRLVTYIRRHDRVWFATCEQIADHVRGLASTPRYAAPAMNTE